MKLTYIFHSGFILETEQSIIVFDYWLDPSGVIDGVLRSDKPLYVFSATSMRIISQGKSSSGGNRNPISPSY